MRVEKNNARSVRDVYLFSDVHKGLADAFEILASQGIKTPGYEPPTSSATAEKTAYVDRVAQAVWIKERAEECLTPIEWAWVVATYHRDAGISRSFEGHKWSESRDTDAESVREASLAILAAMHAGCCRVRGLVPAVIERELSFGETYCKSLPQIATELYASQSTVERVARRVREAFDEIAENVTAALGNRFAELGYMRRPRR